MEVNGHLLVVFSVFFLILFILNLMHEYEGSIKIQNM
jgi:hypothetical protein